LGHALGLRHDNRPNHDNPDTPADGKCGVAPMKKTIMDYDCYEDDYAGHIKVPQPWDSCGLNHLYYRAGWGYSGCN
jgi:hypothetical protein